MERRLFVLQRLSAMVLGPWVLIHLGLIFYATRDGLTAAEILARTQGSIGWAVFYGVFVAAVAVHAPIGLRNILTEWTALRTGPINAAMLALSLLLAALGLRAVWAVVG